MSEDKTMDLSPILDVLLDPLPEGMATAREDFERVRRLAVAHHRHLLDAQERVLLLREACEVAIQNLNAIHQTGILATGNLHGNSPWVISQIEHITNLADSAIARLRRAIVHRPVAAPGVHPELHPELHNPAPAAEPIQPAAGASNSSLPGPGAFTDTHQTPGPNILTTNPKEAN